MGSASGQWPEGVGRSVRDAARYVDVARALGVFYAFTKHHVAAALAMDRPALREMAKPVHEA